MHPNSAFPSHFPESSIIANPLTSIIHIYAPYPFPTLSQLFTQSGPKSLEAAMASFAVVALNLIPLPRGAACRRHQGGDPIKALEIRRSWQAGNLPYRSTPAP